MASWASRVRAALSHIGISCFNTHVSFAFDTSFRRVGQSLAVLLMLPAMAFGQAQMSTPGGFSVSPGGAATYSIPIQVPPGTASMQPGLALTYNSQAGNGMAGAGWSLSGFSSINRCPRTIAQDGAVSGITLTNNDAFCLDGQRLMSTGGAYGAAGTEYRTEIESFSRITTSGVAGNGPYYFIVESKSGQSMVYVPIISAGQATAHIWALAQVRDKLNNCMQISNSTGATGQELYPTAIYYSGRYNTGTGGCDTTYNRIDLVYENRPDTSDGFFGPARVKQNVRLSRIDIVYSAGLIKRYQLGYNAAPASGRSRLGSVTEYAGDGVTALPATTFNYFDGGGGITVSDNRTPIASAGGWGMNYVFVQGDFNGDGITDLYLLGSSTSYFCPGPGVASANNCIATLTGNFRSALVQTGDFNGDGITDLYLVEANNGGWSFFCPGGYPTLGACVQTTSGAIGSGLFSGTFQAGDFDGDGRTDLFFKTSSSAVICPTPQITTVFSFANCYSAVSVPGGTKNKTLVADLDGDGKAEIYLT